MTEQEARERLRAAIEAAGGQLKFAALYGFTNEYVADMAHGTQNLADRILAMVGIERIGTEQIEHWEK
jgi:DNA-binding transcriptional regulator YdaS (Cro superfamily)